MKFLKKLWSVLSTVAVSIFKVLRWYYAHLVSYFLALPTLWKLVLSIPAAIAGLVPVVLLGALPTYFFHPDIGTYSYGIRMGTITDFGPKGFPIVTYEGDMHLGYGSQPWNDPQTGQPANPWQFSAYASAFHAYQNMPPKKHVYVVYWQMLFQLNHLFGLTDYRVLEVHPVDPKLAPEQCGDMTQRAYMSGMPQGYLVKVTTKGNVISTWETQIQKGDGGGSPMNLSITDPKIYACAMLFAKAGVLAQFNYDTALLVRDPTRQATDHAIIGIRKVEDDAPPHD